LIFVSRKLIYIHVQKTGGNSVTTALLPFSDDRMTAHKYQDSVDRFGLSGEFTKRKHALLSDYKTALGSTFNDYKVAVPVRDPIERAISLYFSPRRWMVEKDGIWEKTPPRWDIGEFEAFMRKCFTLTDYISVDGKVQMPDHVIRFTHLDEDFKALCDEYDFQPEGLNLPKLNQSPASTALRKLALDDQRTVDIIKDHFAADFDLVERLL